MDGYSESDLLVRTSSGRVRGALDRGVPSWRGVPYGRVQRRFAPAVAVEAAPGVVDAGGWGPVSWQLPIQFGNSWALVPLERVEDEQCLNLNVWSPGPPRPGEGPRPVLVWLHAGGRVYGSGSTWIDPWHFAARHGVVVVSANYRLGPWGWLYLGGHDPQFADSANLAVRDQVLLLRWVRENAAAFGGDPGSVTLFGMSSGGADVATLLATPSAAGLFHAAAIYSGSAEAAVPLAEAEAFAGEFLAAAHPLAKAPADLLRLPNVALRRVHQKLLERGAQVRYAPVVDGTVVPRAPLEAIGDPGTDAGKEPVPVLVSVTSDEAGMYAAFGPEAVDHTYATLVGEGVGLGGEEKIEALSRQCFWEPATRLLHAVHRGGASVWAQRFAYAPTNSHFALNNPPLAHRAVHGVDTAALFVDPHGEEGSAVDRAVGAAEQAALLALARGAGAPWPRWTPERPVVREIAAEEEAAEEAV